MPDHSHATLLIFHKQIGDLVLLEPVVRACARIGREPVGLIVPRSAAPIVDCMEKAVLKTGTRWPRAQRVYCFDPSTRSSLSALATRSPEKCLFLLGKQYKRRLHSIIYSRIRVEPLRNRYRSHYYQACLGDAQSSSFVPPRLKEPDRPPSSCFPESDYLLVHPTSAWKSKCWRLDAWAEVIRSLRSRTGLPVLVSGGPAEWEQALARSLVEAAGLADSANLAGRTSLQDYLYGLSRSRLTLAVDSSAVHLSRAFSRPTVALFTRSDPRHWFYPGPDAHSFEEKGGETVSPQSVVDTAMHLLEGSN